MKIRLKEALPDDALRLAHFLKKHSDTTMFMRANLANYGIGESDHPHATRFFLREYGSKITGVGALSNTGMVMVQASDGIAEIAEFMKGNVADLKVAGFLGESGMVAEMRAAFGLQERVAYFDDVEPMFSLDLTDLETPPLRGVTLRAACGVDTALLLDWIYAYHVEIGTHPHGAATHGKVKQEVAATLKRGDTSLLIDKGRVVAKTAFNARLPDMVQIGGVYTPPEFRNRGYARRAVALHLQKAKTLGVTRAILFASGEAASKAYIAIGFRQIGHYTITVF